MPLASVTSDFFLLLGEKISPKERGRLKRANGDFHHSENELGKNWFFAPMDSGLVNKALLSDFRFMIESIKVSMDMGDYKAPPFVLIYIACVYFYAERYLGSNDPIFGWMLCSLYEIKANDLVLAKSLLQYLECLIEEVPCHEDSESALLRLFIDAYTTTSI